MDTKKRRYKIDPEFRDLIPPLTPYEYEELEKSILAEGCRDSIYIWKDYVVDGHNRYEICLKHGIEPPIYKIHFESREEVIIWICSVQLARRNITEASRRYLIGKRYETEKMVGAHNVNGNNQYSSEGNEVGYQNETEPQSDESNSRTRERLGKQYHLAAATVYRYGEYSRSIDKIKKISPTTAKKILNEVAHVNTRQLVTLTEQPDNEVRKFCRRLNEIPDEVIPYARTKAMIERYTSEKPQAQPHEKFCEIKKMPSFDPDAEIKSLSLTVPTWAKSIDRVLNSPTTPQSSFEARIRLSTELKALKSASDRLLFKLQEEPYNE